MKDESLGEVLLQLGTVIVIAAILSFLVLDAFGQELLPKRSVHTAPAVVPSAAPTDHPKHSDIGPNP
jgi:hypothetical protein